MTKRYLALALLACVTYSLVAPLLKIAMATIPSTTAVVMSNLVMTAILIGIMAYTGRSPLPYLSHPKRTHIVIWGVALSVGLLAYYRALELGPVSVVVPLFGLFIAVSSVIGIVVLGESITKRKILSIVLAVLAIALMSM